MIRTASTVLSLSLLVAFGCLQVGCSSTGDAGPGGSTVAGAPSGGASAAGGSNASGGAPLSGVSGGGAGGGAPVATAGANAGGAPNPSLGGASSAGGGAGSAPGSAGAGGAPTTTPPSSRVIGYLPNWYGSYASWIPKVDFSKLTHVNLAFALGDANGNLQLAPDADIDAFVSAAHAKGVKVFPSLCGGGGDGKIAPFYEPNLVDSFVDKIIGYVSARKLDGIDVDVEAPQRMGAKYDTFIAKLKAKAGPLGLPVTAAVAQWMQSGMSDTTLRSFDFVNIMSYDATGTWTDAGEHSSYQQALDDIAYYTKKGVAKDKIVLGAPMYGYCWGDCGNGKTKLYVLYKDILAKHPDAAKADWIDANGTKYSYNGTATMAKKTALAAQYGGLMLWELGGDVTTTNADSLLLAISKTPH